MPCIVRLLSPTTIVTASWDGESLADTVCFEPEDGVYTITNTYNTTQVLKMDAHLDRLEDSAQRANIALIYDRVRLRNALREMILAANWGNVRFRITVGRAQPDTLILSIEPFKPLAAEVLERGTRTITAPNAARHNPEAKTTDWAIKRKSLQDAMPSGIYDTFLQDENGYILEGLGSNFYCILNGILYTAGEGVLKGISQQIVLEIASSILVVKLKAVYVSQIPQMQEAFLSSSSRGIVPVVEIDGYAIGDGKVGEKTKALRAAYGVWLATHLEEL